MPVPANRPEKLELRQTMAVTFAMETIPPPLMMEATWASVGTKPRTALVAMSGTVMPRATTQTTTASAMLAHIERFMPTRSSGRISTGMTGTRATSPCEK